VLKDTAEAHSTPHATIYNQLIKLVRDQIGAVASFRQVFVVKRLPKTRSGKILRATIRAMTKKTDVPVPSTIDDPAILDEIREVLKGT
jgi:propionyl-CoA synthetase